MTTAAVPPVAAPGPEWTLPPGSRAADDPLLGSLIALTRLHGRAATPDSLIAGLPLVDQRLTPELAVRAAARAGFSARLVRRPLAEISPLVLPVVLLTTGRGAVVLVARRDDGCVVIQPETGDGEALIPLAELDAIYSGTALFARPAHRYDARVEDGTMPRARHWFWGVLSQGWPVYAEVLVASALVNLFALALPLFTMNVYDRVVPNRVTETLWALSAGVFIVLVFDLLLRTLRAYFIDATGRRMDLILSATIFEKVLGVRMDARPASVGAFASNLQDFDAFREFITSATIAALVDLPFVLVFVAALFIIGGDIGWIAVGAIPLVVGASLLLQRPIAELVQATHKLSAERQSTLVESLVGLETIKVVGAAGALQRKWEQTIARLGRIGLRSRLYSTAAVNLSGWVMQLSSVLVLLVGVHMMEAQSLTVGALVACSILMGRALVPLTQIAQLLTRYHQCQIALAAIERLMALPEERPASQPFLVRPPLGGDIEFREVTFRYPGRQVDSLSAMSFRIRAGERVGIVGRVGSGKTTIAKLVLGLYQPAGGAVLLDGTDLRQLDPAAVRRDIGHVPQDILLFHGSLRDNIVYGAPFADDAAILRAVKLAGVDEFTERSPQGLDLVIGERGEGLSGGQRQALAIARAELLAPPLVLLDEPTSAMDSRSEEQFKARLSASLPGRTLLLVTHRPSLLSLVDRVLVVDGGRVVADGPRDAVMQALATGKVHAAR
jgi:ATP-binding cassette subfamily C protein LapB